MRTNLQTITILFLQNLLWITGAQDTGVTCCPLEFRVDLTTEALLYYELHDAPSLSVSAASSVESVVIHVCDTVTATIHVSHLRSVSASQFPEREREETILYDQLQRRL